jgi:hypothetical protein
MVKWGAKWGDSPGMSPVFVGVEVCCTCAASTAERGRLARTTRAGKKKVQAEPAVSCRTQLSQERVTTGDIASKLQCPLAAEGANGLTNLRKPHLTARKVESFLVTDILCNADRDVVSYF